MTPPADDRPGAIDPGRLVQALIARVDAARAAPQQIQVVRAPGRVNLIGEHTDYNEGFVLPAAIDLEILIALVPTDDRRVELAIEATGEHDGFELDRIGPRRGSWIDYVAGTAWSLAEAGVPTRGFVGLLASSLPQSAGLSSSAALELASAWALMAEPAADLDRMDLARWCQRAENAYVGANCGLMDQFSSALGVDGAALHLDCRSLAWQPVPLPLETHSLVVCHTGSQRRLVTSEYNARRAQCEAAVATIAARHPEVRALRDVGPAMLTHVAELLDPVTLRRCEHVVGENARVGATTEALAAGDLRAVGALFAASHASLRDLYEVSSAELDALVDIAVTTPGVVAARMTGAGFGGCTVNLVERGAEPALRAAVERDYSARTGLRPHVYVVQPVAGAGLVNVA